MFEDFGPAFVHRRDKDNGFNLICLRCLAIVEHREIEADMLPPAIDHVCLPGKARRENSRANDDPSSFD